MRRIAYLFTFILLLSNILLGQYQFRSPVQFNKYVRFDTTVIYFVSPDGTDTIKVYAVNGDSNVTIYWPRVSGTIPVRATPPLYISPQGVIYTSGGGGGGISTRQQILDSLNLESVTLTKGLYLRPTNTSSPLVLTTTLYLQNQVNYMNYIVAADTNTNGVWMLGDRTSVKKFVELYLPQSGYNFGIINYGDTAFYSTGNKVGIFTNSPDSSITLDGGTHIIGNFKLDGTFGMRWSGSNTAPAWQDSTLKIQLYRLAPYYYHPVFYYPFGNGMLSEVHFPTKSGVSTLATLDDIETANITHSITGTDIDWQTVQSPIIAFTDTISSNITYTFSNISPIYGHIDIFITTASGKPSVSFPNEIFWKDNIVGEQDTMPFTTVYRFESIWGKIYGKPESYYPYGMPSPEPGVYSGWFVDAINGNDGDSGTYTHPWKTLDKIKTSIFTNNDTIHLKRGQTWEDTLYIPSNGITVDAYGVGAKPIITAKDTLQSPSGLWNSWPWSQYTGGGDSIYRASYTSLATTVKRMWFNGVEYGEAYTIADINSRFRFKYSGGYIYVFTTTDGVAPSTEYTSLEIPIIRYYAVHCNGRTGVTLRNLQIEGGYNNLYVVNSRAFKLDSCTVTNNQYAGLNLNNSNASQITACLFDYNDTINHNWEQGAGSGDGVYSGNSDSVYIGYTKFISHPHSMVNLASSSTSNHTRYWTIEGCEFTAQTEYSRPFDIHGYRKDQTTGIIMRGNWIHHVPTRSQFGGNKNFFVGNIIDTVYSSGTLPGGSNARAQAFFVTYIDSGSVCDSNVFAYNYIGNTDDWGIYVSGNLGTSIVTNNYIYNNILQNCNRNPYSSLVSGKYAGLCVNKLTSKNYYRNNIVISDSSTSTISYRPSADNEQQPITITAFNVKTDSGDIISGNLASNPLVKRIKTLLSYYKPNQGSPAIDGGYAIPGWWGEIEDFAGTTMPNGSATDIGAYDQQVEAGDGTAPSTITMVLDSLGILNNAYLHWTAVGDDGLVGFASKYLVKYYTDSITDANWSSAIELSPILVPDTSGTIEYYKSGAVGVGTWWFAVKAWDGTNWSNVSNSDSATAASNPAYALGLNGSSQYAYKTTPSNLAFDSTEMIPTQTNKDFETSTGNWQAVNDCIIAQDATPFGGTYSLKATFDAANGPDSCKLGAAYFGALTTNHWYVVEFRVRHTQAPATNYPKVGVGSITKQLGGLNADTWYHRQITFKATTNTIGKQFWIKPNSSSATDIIYLDSVRMYERRPFTILAWSRHTKDALAGTQPIISNMDAGTMSAFKLSGTTANKFQWGLRDASGGDYSQTWDCDSTNVIDSVWTLCTFVHDMNLTAGDSTKNCRIYEDTVVVRASFPSLIDYGKLENLDELYVGKAPATSTYWKGEIGQIQIVVGYAFTQSDIINVKTSGILAVPPSGTALSNWRWRSNLTDYNENNNLSGTVSYKTDVGYPIK